MILQGAGEWYKCPMIINTTDEVCEVHPKFDRRCSKLMAEDRDGQGGFEDVHMAQELIEMHIYGLVEHIVKLFEDD
jgi:hypothetical protein